MNSFIANLVDEEFVQTYFFGQLPLSTLTPPYLQLNICSMRTSYGLRVGRIHYMLLRSFQVNWIRPVEFLLLALIGSSVITGCTNQESLATVTHRQGTKKPFTKWAHSCEPSTMLRSRLVPSLIFTTTSEEFACASMNYDVVPVHAVIECNYP